MRHADQAPRAAGGVGFSATVLQIFGAISVAIIAIILIANLFGV